MKKYILLICMLALTACTNQAAETTTIAETSVAEETTIETLALDSDMENSGEFTFNTKTIKNEAADESIFSNYDITMINVWATYCGPCIVEMPILEEVYQELKAMNCNLIGIVADTVTDTDEPYYVKNLETANEIAYDNGVTFTSLQTDFYLYDYMSNRLKLNAVPTTFFVDKNGKRIGSFVVGVHSKDEYIEYAKLALEEAAE